MRKYLFLYGVFFLYSLIPMMEKTISHYAFWSKTFLLLFSVQISLLFLYAILWQRILKLFSLNQAYINKGSVFLFNSLWSVIIFGESISFKEIAGIICVLAGIYFINSGN